MAVPSQEFLDLQHVVAGRYLVECELGRGGMGIVFLARDVALERPVAIKVLPRHLASDDTLRERFLREARIAAQLSHPNIVPIHTVEAHETIIFFVMAFVEGETLAARVAQRGPLASTDAVRLMQELTWALGYAHGRGVVHRDIKPENVLLERASGRALLADFGIARLTTQTTLSAEGTLVGTVQYMSPEQASSETVDGRSDLYSLAATMYFALTGASPVEGGTLPMMLVKLISEAPPSVAAMRPDLAPGFSGAIMKCLGKTPDDRFATADVLGVALRDAAPSDVAISPPVRAFLREFAVGRTMPFIGIGIISLALAANEIHFMDNRSTVVITLLGAILAAFLPISVGTNLAALREEGVGFTELDRALALEGDSMLRERSTRAETLERTARKQFAVIGYLYVVLGVAGIGLFVMLGWRPGDPVGLVAWSSGVAILGAVSLWLAKRRSSMPRWFMRSPKRAMQNAHIGRWPVLLLRKLINLPFMRRFLDRQVPGHTKPAIEHAPTATLLMNSVSQLLEMLPADVRSELGAVPAIAESLERSIARLRDRAAVLAAAAAEVAAPSPAHAEFLAELTGVRSRIAEATAELDSLRTSLLRLSTGLVAASGLTAELERAHRVSLAIDGRFHGRAGAERAFSGI